MDRPQKRSLKTANYTWNICPSSVIVGIIIGIAVVALVCRNLTSSIWTQQSYNDNETGAQFVSVNLETNPKIGLAVDPVISSVIGPAVVPAMGPLIGSAISPAVVPAVGPAMDTAIVTEIDPEIVNLKKVYKLWDIAPEQTLKDLYFPYERCVMALAQRGEYDITKDVHSQPKCAALITPPFSQINKRCWLGARQQRSDNGVCTKDINYVRCTPLVNRTSFWKHWTHMTSKGSVGESTKQTSLGYGGELVDALSALGYNGMNFIGDSMAIQMAQRLVCSLHRRGGSITLYGDFFSLPLGQGTAAILHYNLTFSKTTVAKNMSILYTRFPPMLGLYRQVYNGKTRLTGIDQACGPPFPSASEARAHDQLSSITVTDGGLDTNQYINTPCRREYTYSHLYNFTLKEWEWEPIAKGVLDAAVYLRNQTQSRIVVLSPLAQHFLEHPTGFYVNISNRNAREFALRKHNSIRDDAGLSSACGPHQEVLKMMPDTSQFLKYLDSVNPHWSDIIKFLDVTIYSNPAYDLHPEYGSSGWAVDCTHYGFHPSMYDPIWEDMRKMLVNN